MSQTTTIFRIMGTTDDFLTCDCCGRTDLKRTMIMAVCDAEGCPTGQVMHFGTSCGARHAGISALELEKLAKAADERKASEAAAARQRELDSEADRFIAFVSTRSAKPSHFERLQELGGFRAARAMFEAAA